MQLADLVATSNAVAATSKRSRKTELIAQLLERALQAPTTPHSEQNRDVWLCVAFVSGQVRQAKLGIGYATVAALREPPQATSSLTLSNVDDALESVATAKGAGSTKAKQDQLRALFGAATLAEQRFLSALLVGELRQGALEGVLLDAVSRASGVAVAELRRALLLRGNLVHVSVVALTEGAAGLTAFKLVLFQPLEPMLAQPGVDTEAALATGPMQAEFKLDGARIQVHKRGNEVRVYSRQLNDVTVAVPEIVDTVGAFAAESLILDGEALAMKHDGKPFAFQDTMRRFGRKTAPPRELQQQLPLACYFFDCLHKDGADIFSQPYEERQRTLDTVTLEQRVPRERVNDAAAVDSMFERALKAGHEGLVLKSLDSSYEPGRRGTTWLKLKPVHTLDLVVLAAEWGSGRRKGTLSNLHLGARGSDGFVMLGKTFKGLTDALLAYQTTELLARESHREGHIVYVRPELVVEIAFDGVQRSPQYPGGVALRFARVKRYRPDKNASESDTIEQVLALVTE